MPIISPNPQDFPSLTNPTSADTFIVVQDGGINQTLTIARLKSLLDTAFLGTSPTGPQYIGIRGYTGSKGFQGYQGVQGMQGAQGSQGLQSSQGSQGFQGIQGLQGLQGLQGEQGIQGNLGLQGLQGFQGFQGVQGVQGLQGSGIQGTQGLQGLQGEQGIQGLQGLQGTGIQGLQGLQGEQGTQGLQGLQGLQIQGTQGLQGVQGDVGPIGYTGSKGIRGSDGPTGPAGYTGSTGIVGPSGPSGPIGYTGSSGVAALAPLDSQQILYNYAGEVKSSLNFKWDEVNNVLTITGNVDVNGDIQATGSITPNYTVSDQRLKTNISILNNALEKTLKLDGISFNWNELAKGKNLENREIGVLAQQVREVLPEAVGQLNDTEYLTIRYEMLIPLLIQSIKELTIKFENLKDMINQQNK